MNIFKHLKLSNKAFALLLATTAFCCTQSGQVMADDGETWTTFDKDRWIIRGRIIDIEPIVDNTSTGIAGSIDIDNAVMPELDITYFWTKNIATELILATAEHDVKNQSPDVDLGSAWILPPTLTLQYHFKPEDTFRPYVGAGVNYSLFYNEDSGGVNDIDYDSSFGGALQAGFDYEINENWAWNFDVKKVWISTDVTINGGAITADVDIDPVIIGTGLAYRF